MAKKEKQTDELLDENQEQAEPKGEAKKDEAKQEAKPAAAPAQDADKMKSWKSKEEQTKHKLSLQPKVSFLVPLMPGEMPGAYETVQINGYRLTIKKGVMVEVPKSVAEILAAHYQVQLTAGQEKRIDRSQEVSDALS